MLSYNEKDYNLSTICKRLQAGLEEFRIKDYYIYGIKQENTNGSPQPHILLRTKRGVKLPHELLKLFKRSNINVVIDGLSTRAEITIGFRKDVRDNIQFSKNLIKTIIFAIEGKLILEDEFVIAHTLGD